MVSMINQAFGLTSHYPQLDGVSKQLVQLSDGLNEIQVLRKQVGYRDAKKTELQQKIQEIQTLVETPIQSGLAVTLSNSEKSRQHLIQIQEHIRVLAPNKTLSKKIDVALSTNWLTILVPSTSPKIEPEKPREMKEEKASITQVTAVRPSIAFREILANVRNARDLVDLFDKYPDYITDICLYIINTYDCPSVTLALTQEFFNLLSNHDLLSSDKREKIIENLAKRFDEITGQLLAINQPITKFCFDLLLKAKEYHSNNSRSARILEKIEFNINKFIHMIVPNCWSISNSSDDKKLNDMDWVLVEKTEDEVVKHRAEDTLNWFVKCELLNKELVIHHISNFIKNYSISNDIWEPILQKSGISLEFTNYYNHPRTIIENYIKFYNRGLK